MTTVQQVPQLRSGEPRGRWVLAVTVLGSGMAFLDATVVNVALPAIGRDLDADLAGLQWTVNGFTLTLAAFILLGGSAGDRYGRRRVFVVGVVWFAAASMLCGLAPNLPVLVAARALQGVGGALLTPGSLAILQASFREEDRGRVIGSWSGLAGIAGAVGPLLGGWMVQSASWRLVFLVNVPVAVFVVAAALRHVPETSDPDATGAFDVAGGVVCAVGLGAVTYALVSLGAHGSTAASWVSLAVGVAAALGFVRIERTSQSPMLPFGIFDSRLFRAVNAVTFLVYAALGGVFFMLVITLQVVAGFPPVLAGASLLPVTALMLVLSGPAGAMGQRIGPRIPLTVGPLLSAAGTLLLSLVDSGASYLTDVLPGVALFGLGLSVTVAPLTATVLAAAPLSNAGAASGVNNAVARTAGLLIVAALPAITGLSGSSYADPAALQSSYTRSMVFCAGLLASGAALAVLLVRAEVEPGPAPAPVEPLRCPATPCRVHCAVAGPPLQPSYLSLSRRQPPRD